MFFLSLNCHTDSSVITAQIYTYLTTKLTYQLATQLKKLLDSLVFLAMQYHFKATADLLVSSELSLI